MTTENNEFVLPKVAEQKNGELRYLTDDALFESTGVRIAFSSRHGGVSTDQYASLNTGFNVGDDVFNVLQNRSLLLGTLTGGGDEVLAFSPRQVHGDSVVVIKSLESAGVSEVEADAVICSERSVAPILSFADCCPVVLVAENGVFAVVHAGWRGVVNLISSKVFSKLVNDFGCDAKKINAYVGPHIGRCCFEVESDTKDAFLDVFGDEVVNSESGDKYHIDMTLALKKQLVEAGIDEKRFLDVDICTSCNSDDYFSYRAQNGDTGRIAALAFRL